MPDLNGVTLTRREHGRVSSAVRRAWVAGRIPCRDSCEECGSTHRVVAHHDDYSQPLNVKWLCGQHHRERHHHINRVLRERRVLL